MRVADTRSRNHLAQVPEFIRTVHLAAAVPEYGQRNVNKPQIDLIISISCASQELAYLLHWAYPEPRDAVH